MSESIFRNRRRGRAFWLALPVLLFAYLLFFPHPGGKESTMRAVWVKDLSKPGTATSSAAQPQWPFRAGDRFGYADLEGNLYYVGRRLHNLSLSNAGFINYGSVPDHIVFMNPRGEFEFSIKSFGYPLLGPDPDVLYSINTDRSGLKRIDIDGAVLWSLNFTAPLTSIALAGEEVLIGLMDGRALVVGAEGRALYQYVSETGRIGVTLGTAYSEDRNQIAFVSGIDPQRLEVLQRREAEFTTELIMELSSDFRREVQLQFSPDSRFLYFEIEDGLGVLDVRKNTVSRLIGQGMLSLLDGSDRCTAAAFRREAGSQLLIFRPLESKLFNRELAAERVYLKVLGNSVILGLDGFLLRADLVQG